MESIRRGFRATGRTFKGLGIVAGLLWNVYVKRPKGEDLKDVSNKFYNDLRELLGIKIVFNEASAPIEQNDVTWYVANHMSIADFIVMGSVLRNGTFAGKELKLPQGFLDVGKYIGIPRVGKDHPDFQDNNRKTMGRIMQNFNDKQSTIMFPEGTITDGSQVALFRAGLLNGLFDGVTGLDRDGNDVDLEQHVNVQAIGIKVLDVEGKCVNMRPELRHYYSHYTSDNTLKRIWTRLATKSITIELKVFDKMNPADFEDGKALANKAGEDVRSFVVPDQVGFVKAKIPGVAERGEKAEEPPKPKGLY